MVQTGGSSSRLIRVYGQLPAKRPVNDVASPKVQLPAIRFRPRRFPLCASNLVSLFAPHRLMT